MPIQEVLDNPVTPQEIKDKIQLMQEVRQFVIDFSDSDNYTTYYDQKGKEILWNLSACEPFEFKTKKGKFPPSSIALKSSP